MSDSFVENIIKLSRYADKLNRRKSSSLDIFDWDANRYSGKVKQTKWLVDKIIPQGVPLLFAGQGGIGKSYSLLALATSVATYGKSAGFSSNSFLCDKVVSGGNVVYFSAEDSKDEVHRRLLQIDPEQKIQQCPERLRVIPLSDAGGAFAITRKNQQGHLEITPEFDLIFDQLLEIEDLALVIFDPLQVFAQADIDKDNTAAQYFCNQMRYLASETGATIIISHHMRKPDQAHPIANLEMARDAVRGASGLVDGVRGVICMWTHKKQIFAGVAKSNYGAEQITYELKRLESGILISDAEGLQHDKNMVLDIIAECANNEHLTSTGKRSLFDRRKEFADELADWSRKKCESIILQLLESEEIEKDKNSNLVILRSRSHVPDGNENLETLETLASS